MSRNSKAVWGPACWTLMHASAAACEPQEARAFAAFLWALGHVLPCPECRQHLRTYLRNHPPEAFITGAPSASRFCFDLHNYVNIQTGKPAAPPSLVRELYAAKLTNLRRSPRDRPGGSPRRIMPFPSKPYRML
jgi:hypothetical protein